MPFPPNDPIAHEREEWRRRVRDHDAARAAGTALLDGDQRAVDEGFLARGLPAPRIVIDPDPATLDLPEHAALLRFWRGMPRRDGADLPARADLRGEDLHGLLGDLLLLEADETGADFIYRIYGSKIARNAGQDWTGWSAGAMGLKVGAGPSLFYRGVYIAAARARKPIYSAHDVPDWIEHATWRRLIVPLTDESGAARWFLVANIPTGLRRPDISRQAEMRRHLGPTKTG